MEREMFGHHHSGMTGGGFSHGHDDDFFNRGSAGPPGFGPPGMRGGFGRSPFEELDRMVQEEFMRGGGQH